MAGKPASQSRLLDAAKSRRVFRNLTVITGAVLAVALFLHFSASSFGQAMLGLMLLWISAPLFVLFAVMYIVSVVVESRQAGKAREHAALYVASALVALAILALLLFRLIA